MNFLFWERDTDFFSTFYEDNLIIHHINTDFKFITCWDGHPLITILAIKKVITININNNDNNKCLEWLAQERCTLIRETFARETFVNFVIFAVFSRSVSRKPFENSNSQKFISEKCSHFSIQVTFFISNLQFSKVPKVFWKYNTMSVSKGNVNKR